MPSSIEANNSIYNEGPFTLDPLLWRTLNEQDAAQVCSRCWVEAQQGGGYSFSFLNQECSVCPHDEKIYIRRQSENREANFQEALVVLTYLARASNTPPAGVMVTEKELKGGLTFFQGPHALMTRPLLKRFAHAPGELVRAGEALGGVKMDLGDSAVKVRPLPKIPLTYVLYAADDEFDARMVVIFDQTIQIHLPLDVIWALVNVTTSTFLKT